MLNSLTYSLPQELETAVRAKFDAWSEENKIARIWSKDAGVWTNEDEANWLGWLNVVERELNDLQKYRDFSEDARNFSDVVLLGMGGSSLTPEVLAITFGEKNFHILDSTVPAQIKALENKIALENTLFIVASKSGSTLEPNTFKQYFFDHVSDTGGKKTAGRQFAAITDPNSKMQKTAERDDFRKIFFGEPEIGGRFSALSVFGMAAGAAMDLDVENFLRRAQEIVEACREENPEKNPGAILGTILGVCHNSGRDKMTIFTSADIYDLGAWLEQLIAESTGKQGVSIIPVDREMIQPPENYGSDRVFVYIKLEGIEDATTEAQIDAIEKSGQPVVRIALQDKMNLGQEFFRWEFATAVAGAIMQINPFNQPDVEAAKIEARKLTDEYEKTGELPFETPFYEEDGIKLFTDEKNVDELNRLLQGEKSLANYLKAHFSRIKENDYFALLAYLEMNGDTEEFLQKIRHHVLDKHKVATCLGFGPRFLHSTGQAYKGGANNGVFLQITSDDAEDFGVPEQKYTFGVVKAAQARGDFQVLLDRNRRALHVHLSADVMGDLDKLFQAVS
jgi:transaldolase / glucose-6-phosphate isomerase